MTFGGLGISTSGMLTSQIGLDVTSNNIANANTVGYSRKTINFSEGSSASNNATSTIRLLSGVVVDKIERIRNQFLDQQVRQQNANLGRDQTISDLTVAMNDILGEPSETGLTAKLNQFFQAASDWAANPELETARTVFINSASALSDSFNQIDDAIRILTDNIESQPTGMIPSNINDLNAKLESLAEVHRKALAFDSAGGEAAELKDQRDLLLDEISNILDVNIDRSGDGSMRKLTMDVNASEAIITSTNSFPNHDSTIAGITAAGGTNTLVLTVDNGNGSTTGPFTVTFNDTPTIREVVEKINKTFRASGGKGSVASVDNTGALELQTALIDDAINNTTAAVTIGAGSTSLVQLGLAPGTVNGTNAIEYTLLDNSGLKYLFDVEPGFGEVGSNPSKLILRNNDPLQAKFGVIDSFSGVLGGLFQMVNEDIHEMRTGLSEFAMNVKRSVNDILQLGMTSNGNAGAALFIGNTARDFAVSETVLSNNSLITPSKTGAVSDGAIAAEIADLFFGDNNTVSDNTRSQKVFIDSPSATPVTSAIPVIPGQTVTVRADGIVDDNGSAVNAGTNGFGGGSLVQIEFINAAGAVIGGAIDFPASAGAPVDSVTYSGAAPAGAAFVRFVMNGATFNDNNIANNSGHFGITVIQGVENDADSNFNNRISNIVGDFGTKGNVAISKAENSENLYNSLDDRRQSIMGVSIEEEAANLIRFQNSFSANARVMSVWDQIFQEIINIL